MTDDRELEGLDPYAIQDAEAARIDRFLSAMPDGDPAWDAPTRCSDWSRRQLLAHLAGTEEYHQACMADTLGALLEKGMAAGVSDVGGFNALLVAERDGRAPSEVLAEWRAANAETRRRFRERGDADMTTMVGPYPARWQAFHVASELAIHADDLGVPIETGEADERLAWRTHFCRFSLPEAKPELSVRAVPGGTEITADGVALTLDDATFVEAVAGRATASGLDEATLALLSTSP